jgi:hypothetical protein
MSLTSRAKGRTTLDAENASKRSVFGPFFNVFVLQLLASLLLTSHAAAQSVRTFEMGGQQWTVPSQYLVVPIPAVATTFTIRLPLPSEVHNKNPAKGGPARDSSPFLTATISTEPRLVDGALLKHYERSILHCETCSGYSSLGGLDFSNYNGADLPPFKNGEPFNLYVNGPADVPRFVVCHFDSLTGKPLPCEVSETINAGKFFLDYRLPPEYAAETFALDSGLKTVIGSFQSSWHAASSTTPSLLSQPTNCWRPQPGSDGARLVDLLIGPQHVEIPIAYGSFGSFSPTQQIIEIYLTLPNLQPVSPTDMSPLLATGFYHYTHIYISYNDRALFMHPSLTAAGDMKSLFNDETPLGSNAILPYKMYKEHPNYYDIGEDELYYSADPQKTFSTFPPSDFRCSSFAPGASADCEFQVSLGLSSKISNKPDAGLDVAYSFSKDYFSQIPFINSCLLQIIQSILPNH